MCHKVGNAFPYRYIKKEYIADYYQLLSLVDGHKGIQFSRLFCIIEIIYNFFLNEGKGAQREFNVRQTIWMLVSFLSIGLFSF